MSDENTPQIPAEHPQLRSYSLKNQKKTGDFDLKKLTTGELLQLRDEIDGLLPPMSLKSLNVEQEVIMQFHRLKALQTEVANEDGVPTNQRAQVANSVAKVLNEIVRIRNELYNGEQCRLMEAALAKALRSQPEAFQSAFFEAYGKTLEQMATVTELIEAEVKEVLPNA